MSVTERILAIQGNSTESPHLNSARYQITFALFAVMADLPSLGRSRAVLIVLDLISRPQYIVPPCKTVIVGLTCALQGLFASQYACHCDLLLLWCAIYRPRVAEAVHPVLPDQPSGYRRLYHNTGIGTLSRNCTVAADGEG